MPPVSAGVLLYRRRGASLEVFLVHPGGPYWAKKDDGAWSVPKGLVDVDEEELACARREFKEETGFDAPVEGPVHDLGTFRQPSGKRLHVWAIEGDCDAAALRSNLFEMEWPPKSGRTARFPEVDRGGWFDRAQASRKIASGQRPILEKFYGDLGQPTPGGESRQMHWEEVYSSRSAAQFSWYEANPQHSLQLIRASNLSAADAIIDVGAGASTLVDELLRAGFQDLTLLDISGAALQSVRERLGARAGAVKFLRQDVTEFEPTRRYALWHDRAVFHFLLEPAERARYVQVLRSALRPGGFAVISTFGPAGPQRCSGLSVMRYGAGELSAELGGSFTLLDSMLTEHQTPRGQTQQFLWCRFERTREGGARTVG